MFLKRRRVYFLLAALVFTHVGRYQGITIHRSALSHLSRPEAKEAMKKWTFSRKKRDHHKVAKFVNFSEFSGKISTLNVYEKYQRDIAGLGLIYTNGIRILKTYSDFSESKFNQQNPSQRLKIISLKICVHNCN